MLFLLVHMWGSKSISLVGFTGNGVVCDLDVLYVSSFALFGHVSGVRLFLLGP